MNIIEKIKNGVEAVTGLPFYYDTPQTLNERLDRAVYPCAMLNIVESGAIMDANGVLHERMTIEVLFTINSNLDFDGLDVEKHELDRMKWYAFKWLVSLFGSRDLRLVSMNSTNRYYATNDAINSAYGVNITIEEIVGVSKCDYA